MQLVQLGLSINLLLNQPVLFCHTVILLQVPPFAEHVLQVVMMLVGKKRVVVMFDERVEKLILGNLFVLCDAKLVDEFFKLVNHRYSFAVLEFVLLVFDALAFEILRKLQDCTLSKDIIKLVSSVLSQLFP